MPSRQNSRASPCASSAPAPSACSPRIGQEYASSIHAVDVVNSSDAAHFIVWKRDGWLAPYLPEDVAKHYPAEHKDPDGMFASFRGLALHHRLQYQHRESRRGAQELCRSARSEMDRQARQGASRLQRHDHDRDLPDAARSRLGLFREARQAEGHAGAVVRRSAEEACARRTLGDGRRQRVQYLPDEGNQPAGRARLCDRRLAADRRAERHLQECAKPERRAAVPELLLHAGMPAADHRCRRPALRASADEGKGRPHAVQGHQVDEGRPGARRKAVRGDQEALHQDLPASE